uniref:Uncharacterized protein n=1 Tax=Romanomermis culicivorax TaxID=13658 RepID=A0A915JNX5_ROMCU
MDVVTVHKQLSRKERFLQDCRRGTILPIPIAPVLLLRKSYCCRGTYQANLINVSFELWCK